MADNNDGHRTALDALVSLKDHPGYQILVERLQLMAIEYINILVDTPPDNVNELRKAQYMAWRYRELSRVHEQILTDLVEQEKMSEHGEGQGLPPENPDAILRGNNGAQA